MTLDEAIYNYENDIKLHNDRIEFYNKLDMPECIPLEQKTVDIHGQICDWLKELKSLREHKSKTGKWIKCIDDEGFTLPYKNCSECGEIGVLRMNFCPNCGMKMER